MSVRSVVAVVMLGAALPGTAPIQAQQTPAANPLDVVPDKMPFDIPYGTPISLERAEAAIAATVAEAMVRVALRAPRGVHIYDSDEIERLGYIPRSP